MKCGQCDNTDGLCYTSNPPKCKCTITGEFHYYDDECNVNTSMNVCKYCGKIKLSHHDYNFCPYCGKSLQGGFIPITIFNSFNSTCKNKINYTSTYLHNKEK